MAILALDLGTKTGWATEVRETVISGTESFANDRFSGGGMRYLKFIRWLDLINNDINEGVTEVWYEEVQRHVGTIACQVYGGFMAHLMAWCEEKKIPYQGVPVGTIKKFWCGKGNASKPDMIAEAIKRGFKPGDDNEADAIAILKYALNKTAKDFMKGKK